MASSGDQHRQRGEHVAVERRVLGDHRDHHRGELGTVPRA
jgi:hypothetical protein